MKPDGDEFRGSKVPERFTIKVSGRTHGILTTIKGELEKLFNTNISMEELIYAILVLKIDLANFANLPPDEGGPESLLMSEKERRST